jgi:hypothetical protein
VAHQFERSHVVLGLGQHVHGQEPARQSQLGRLEDRAADDAALVAAGGALEVQPALAAKQLLCPQPQAGQAKPAGQRESISAASHLSSLP